MTINLRKKIVQLKIFMGESQLSVSNKHRWDLVGFRGFKLNYVTV